MQNLSLQKIIDFSGAELLFGAADLIIEEIVIDSREVKDNYLFIAIIGENQDGHQYLEEAIKNGASALIVDREIKSNYINDISILKVEDTTKALQDIAHNYRLSFKNLKVIAVTGSAGKTTTKDLIYALLSQKYNCLKTKGNFNNQIGLPLTLLRLTGREKFAVVEMGMSSLGEIDLLAKIAVPDIGIVTNVAAVHLENLANLENIAKAKKELIDNLSKTGIAILNYDNFYTRKMAEDNLAEILYFGFEDGADIQALSYTFNQDKDLVDFTILYKNEKFKFKFNKAGKHNIYNLMAALIIAFKYNLSQSKIQEALLKVEFSDLRMEFIELKNGVKIINDSYNSNPIAVKAALDVLFEKKGKRKIAVLASMLELGKSSVQKHREIGEYAAGKSLDILITIGQEAENIASAAVAKMKAENIFILADNQACINLLRKEMQSGDLILIKGSRANKLEEIVKELRIEEY